MALDAVIRLVQLRIKLPYMSSTNTNKPKEVLRQLNKVVVLQIQDSLFRFTPNYSRSNSSPIQEAVL